ncbi:MAG TPA: hypothetical protein VK673_17580, partial [Chthoniobacterales bacterium]|nr:hypothetical protein [Chthoniobacterales bacterium]
HKITTIDWQDSPSAFILNFRGRTGCVIRLRLIPMTDDKVVSRSAPVICHLFRRPPRQRPGDVCCGNF